MATRVLARRMKHRHGITRWPEKNGFKAFGYIRKMKPKGGYIIKI